MKEEPKKLKFEVKFKQQPDGKIDKAIFINGEMFDYSIDQKSYNKACEMGPDTKGAVQQNITEHFVNSLSEFLERKVTMADVINAINTGWI